MLLLMKKIPFTGSGVAIVTPFIENGVDFVKLGELVEFQIENKTDAIIVCGTTGESATMPDDEHKAAIKYVVDKVNGRIPVIAGTGMNDTRHCLDLSKYAETVGADALLLVTPYYNKTTQKGLIEHFSYIAASVNLPIILYNVPSRTGLNISADTAFELSKIDNIVAIKEASGNIALATSIAAKCGDALYLYSGNDDMVVPLMSLGAKGVISVAANIIPSEMHDMVMFYLNGNTEQSLKLQLELLNLIDALFVEVNPIPVKTAMNLLGYDVGKLRMPLCDMTQKNLELLEKTLKDYGLFDKSQ